MQESDYSGFPAILGAMTNEQGSYESQCNHENWPGQEYEEWPAPRVIAAVTRGKGNDTADILAQKQVVSSTEKSNEIKSQ